MHFFQDSYAINLINGKRSSSPLLGEKGPPPLPGKKSPLTLSKLLNCSWIANLCQGHKWRHCNVILRHQRYVNLSTSYIYDIILRQWLGIVVCFRSGTIFTWRRDVKRLCHSNVISVSYLLWDVVTFLFYILKKKTIMS